MSKLNVQFIVFLFFAFLAVLPFWTQDRRVHEQTDDVEILRLEAALAKSEIALNLSESRISELAEQLEHLKKPWPHPIAVLVFVCNRSIAIRQLVRKLLRYRPDEKAFPIIVSQDCDDEDVRKTVEQFGEQVEYVKHPAARGPERKRKWSEYYSIARHYKLGLTHAFNKYATVIVTEDDLDISADFFSFFASTRFLLDVDPKVWCVSAWNDNGQAANIDADAVETLYRTDFFGGLGWMTTRATWQELSATWPAAFWDDYMRRATVRKGRQCIRPEVPRTGMTYHGQRGASRGQFFDKHLKRVAVNRRRRVDFGALNLTYLLESPFDRKWRREVWQEAIHVEDVPHALNASNRGKSVRIVYTSCRDFSRKARELSIMNDLKDGVPRTAYRGVVTCFRDGIRIFLAPDPAHIQDYVPGCENQ